jgi:hypothetical protein
MSVTPRPRRRAPLADRKAREFLLNTDPVLARPRDPAQHRCLLAAVAVMSARDGHARKQTGAALV